MLCSTTHVYHYLPATEPEPILRDGLRHLSDMPDHPNFDRERSRFERPYYDLAWPVLQRPYVTSGIFFTTVDLRRVNGRGHLACPRLAVPIGRLDPDWSVLTFEYDGVRQRFPLSSQHVQAAALLWTRDRIERWLGADETGWFRYVPQVITFRPGGVRIEPADVDCA
jgi:hypothetical protein